MDVGASMVSEKGEKEFGFSEISNCTFLQAEIAVSGHFKYVLSSMFLMFWRD